MKAKPFKKPNPAEKQELVNSVRIYVMTLTERAMKKTGLSEDFCREMVIRDMARRRGMLSPASQEFQGGDIAGTPTAKGE